MPEPKQKSATPPAVVKDGKDAPKEKPAPPPTPLAVIKSNIQLVERAVSTLEPRFTHRVLRSLNSLRKKLNANVLKDAAAEIYPKGPDTRSFNVWSIHHTDPRCIDSPAGAAVAPIIPVPEAPKDADMDVDVEIALPPAATAPTPTVPTKEPSPEVDVYFRLLLILYYLDHEGNEKATALAHETAEKIHALNRRSLDPIASKVYFYLSRAHEIAGTAAEIRPYASYYFLKTLRVSMLTCSLSLLLAAQRTASLRQDDDCQATLINLLLFNYLSDSLYTQADKLVSKTTFPSSAGNPQLARYLYYLGRIRAVQLSYTEAHTHLQQAIRRAPNGKLAPGFFQTVHKLFIVVELLMGDIPDRGLFRHPVLRKALVPYLHIVQGVSSSSRARPGGSLTSNLKLFEPVIYPSSSLHCLHTQRNSPKTRHTS